MLEKTGYKVGELVRAGGAYSSAGGITKYIYLFMADYEPGQRKGKGGGLEAEDEQVSLVELSFDEAAKMLESGEFHDAKTMLLLQHFFLYC